MTNINMRRISSALNQNAIKNNSTQNKDINRNTDNVNTFKDTLDEIQSKDIKFTKHAKVRMDERNLTLDSIELVKLTEALDKADKKGVKEALIIMNNQAFIANVKSKTIITAVSKDKLSENVFTNIDGAVII